MAYTVRFGKVVKTNKIQRVKVERNISFPYTSQFSMDEPKVFPKDKGHWNGACNRSACLDRPATWYNRGSYAFYCEACAEMLSKVNRKDAYNLLGEGNELCILIQTQEEADKLHVM